jgi:hypothetical protein
MLQFLIAYLSLGLCYYVSVMSAPASLPDDLDRVDAFGYGSTHCETFACLLAKLLFLLFWPPILAFTLVNSFLSRPDLKTAK